jgi:hypothetical protein
MKELMTGETANSYSTLDDVEIEDVSGAATVIRMGFFGTLIMTDTCAQWTRTTPKATAWLTSPEFGIVNEPLRAVATPATARIVQSCRFRRQVLCGDLKLRAGC